ncbi:hypothetical protein tb265_32880 [Gemmatimonadetes bacterium T265]|nr:hypothetical protein tb265_32880 [Gemmatimonadetes bacterium T265]
MSFELLTSQRNALFTALRGVSLNPNDFDWTSRRGDDVGWPASDVPTLAHRSEPFYFAVADNPYGGYNIAYSPGKQTRTVRLTQLIWDAVEVQIRDWAHAVRREVSQVDLWAQITGVAGPLAVASSTFDNFPLTGAEIQVLETGLDRLRAEIQQNRSLDASQTQQLLAAVADIRSAADRVGKKDWVMIFVGALVSTLLAAAVQPEVARVIMDAAGVALQAIVGSPALPPSL